MKKEAIHILLITVLLLAAVPLVLACWAFAVPERYGDTFLGELKEKVALLEETPGKRIVIVGGSAAAFAIDSAEMEENFRAVTIGQQAAIDEETKRQNAAAGIAGVSGSGRIETEDRFTRAEGIRAGEYEVVNFGMYAGLGTKAMLELSEDYLREGDIVLLMPEQQEQSLSLYFGAEYMWQAADGAAGLLAKLDTQDLKGMAASLPEFAAEKMRWFLAGKRPEADNVYRRSSFDENGDILPQICMENSMLLGYDSNSEIVFTEDLLDPEFCEYVRSYADRLQNRGVKVYYHFPPMNAAAAVGTDQLDSFAQTLSERTGLLVLGDPAECLMEPKWFFDTNFHLNAYGRQQFTELVTREMKAWLLDSSPTQIDGPEAGVEESAGEKGSDGDAAAVVFDNSDADCFVAESLADGSWRITGLTEKGRERTSLTVPALIDAQPVTQLSRETFTDCEELLEVTLQENLTFLEDETFAGCVHLETIHIKAQDPTHTKVGTGLLTGSEAVICVPEEALGAYRVNYSWSVYSGRLQAE